MSFVVDADDQNQELDGNEISFDRWVKNIDAEKLRREQQQCHQILSNTWIRNYSIILIIRMTKVVEHFSTTITKKLLFYKPH